MRTPQQRDMSVTLSSADGYIRGQAGGPATVLVLPGASCNVAPGEIPGSMEGLTLRSAVPEYSWNFGG